MANVASRLISRARLGAGPGEDDDVAGSGAWLLPAIALGTTLAPLNSTMIAVALPEIQDAYGASVTATALLVTIYLVAMAAGQPVGGRLGDLYGRRRVYLIGLTWFAIASVGCAFAPNLPWLIAFRTQQALAGALSFPNGAAMVREAVPAERRGSAFGMIGLATGVAAASGPPLGGILVHAFEWSAIFWANVPVVVVALVLGWTSLPRRAPEERHRARFDIAGTLLFASSLGMVILIPALLKLERPMLALGSGVAGVAIGAAFVLWERRVQAPVVEVRLFADRRFAAACLSIALANLVMYTTLLALPLYLEGVLGRSVQVSGLVLAALSAFSAFWGPIGGRWTDRAGRWLPAVTGAVGLFTGVCLLVGGVGASSIALIVVALATMGLGIGIAGAPVQTAAVESVPMGSTGAASGIFSTSRYIGSVVGSSILAGLFIVRPDEGDGALFVGLFVGLAVAALIGIAVNSRIADRHHESA